ncbi:MAG: hypothetical protein ACRD0A_16680 [Acidimicrobiales bacterium]
MAPIIAHPDHQPGDTIDASLREVVDTRRRLELVAEITGQDHEWIVARGTAD